MRRKGEDFLNKIESLRKDLEVQGNAFQIIQDELADERKVMLPGNQNRRETAPKGRLWTPFVDPRSARRPKPSASPSITMKSVSVSVDRQVKTKTCLPLPKPKSLTRLLTFS